MFSAFQSAYIAGMLTGAGMFNCDYCDWQHIVVPYCYAPSICL